MLICKQKGNRMYTSTCKHLHVHLCGSPTYFVDWACRVLSPSTCFLSKSDRSLT